MILVTRPVNLPPSGYFAAAPSDGALSGYFGEQRGGKYIEHRDGSEQREDTAKYEKKLRKQLKNDLVSKSELCKH